MDTLPKLYRGLLGIKATAFDTNPAGLLQSPPHTKLRGFEVPMKGTIKKILRDRGFGFIRAIDEQEVFFHQSGLMEIALDSLKEGDAVEFELEKTAKGLRAVSVRPSAK